MVQSNLVEQTLSQVKKYTPLVGVVTSLVSIPILLVTRPLAVLLGFYLLLTFSYFLFRGTLNRVQVVSNFYLIIRDTAVKTTPRVAKGFMKELSTPWRHGTGIQLKALKYIIQIGFCKKQNLTEETGVLAAIQGRFTDDTPTEIGNW